MYAVMRKNYYDESNLSKKRKSLKKFDKAHKEQPGYLGNITVDLSNGCNVVVNFWKTEEQAAAGRKILEPIVHQLIEPIMKAPSEVIGFGRVISNDLIDEDSKKFIVSQTAI